MTEQESHWLEGILTLARAGAAVVGSDPDSDRTGVTLLIGILTVARAGAAVVRGDPDSGISRSHNG